MRNPFDILAGLIGGLLLSIVLVGYGLPPLWRIK